MVETVAESRRAEGQGSISKVYELSEIKIDENKRIGTSEPELDSVLGGGLVAGMVVLVAGEPGIGKSTLLTQVALKSGLNTLYVCGEESAQQVALRAKRLNVQDSLSKVQLLESSDVDEICRRIETNKPGLVIVDSIQTMRTEDLTGVAGSVGQVRESCQRLAGSAKRLGIPMLVVGHVTKEGTIAGPRVLEHQVDTVLWFEGERGQVLRLVRAVKNRFGATDEVAVFEMSGEGLVGMSDPSKHLLAERVKNVPGSVVTVVLEGNRPMVVEIQALVVQSNLSVPRRVVTGVDMARVQMLVAALIKHANLHIEGVDIFVNVTGGVRLADRGVDLAVCLAVASSFLNRPLAADIAAVGEVGLLGEVRKVGGLEKRVKEAKKLGFRVASAESGRSVGAAIKKLLS
jgi:DNA repair protein RadA/Sms